VPGKGIGGWFGFTDVLIFKTSLSIKTNLEL
jgi:hypothetical protein